MALLPKVAPQHHELFIEAIDDLRKYNLLQPKKAAGMASGGKGEDVRRRQWDRMVGGRRSQANIFLLAGGAIVAFVAGMVLSIVAQDFGVPETVGTIPTFMIGGLLVTPAGIYLGVFLNNTGSFTSGMMKIVVNERPSPIRPEMVSGEVELWVPKVLVAWRAHDWRYDGSQPYLWVQLQTGQTIHEEVRNTESCLELSVDNFRAKDAAVYAQRSFNTMISDNATIYADVEAGDTGDSGKFGELVPYLPPLAISAGGILLVIFSSG